MSSPFEIFIGYAHKDKKYLNQLKIRLASYKSIMVWHYYDISAGQEFAVEIDNHLSTAHCIVLLLSPDFLASESCIREMNKALERHERREVRVIPVLLRPSEWKETSIKGLEILPTKGLALTLWKNEDEAYLNVAQGIRKAAEEFIPETEAATIQNPEDIQAQKVNKKALFRRRFIVSIPLLVICYAFAILWFWNGWSISRGNPVFSVIIAMSAILVMYFQLQFIILFYRDDLFLSYSWADSNWAEWISELLKQHGFSLVLQRWDTKADYIQEMRKAKRKSKNVLTLLSPDYLSAVQSDPKWLHYLKHRNLPGRKGIPVLVHDCELAGPLSRINSINLVGLNEVEACDLLLGEIRSRLKSRITSHNSASLHTSYKPHFPGFMVNVPNSHRFFVGREECLIDLRKKFMISNSTTPYLAKYPKSIAITGLSGMGKTQLAMEYAYKYQMYYQDILWVHATTRQSLISGFVAVAEKLQLPGKDNPDQNMTVAAVRQWMKENPYWLLILNNADELDIVKEFIPTEGKGQVLLTTCVHATSEIAEPFRLSTMDEDEGALLLLRRANKLKLYDGLDKAVRNDIIEARKIANEMGGLPLALEQAGAYMEEAECGLSNYLREFRRLQARLLLNYPARAGVKEIVTSLSLALEKLQQVNPSAVELLRFCSFLGSAPIPEGIIAALPNPGPLIRAIVTDSCEFDRAIKDLLRFSLIHRDPISNTLMLHCLVQSIVREGIYTQGITGRMQKMQALHAIQAVNRIFPNVEFESWPTCQLYLAHAQACILHIERWNVVSVEALRLLYVTGVYLQQRGQYSVVEPNSEAESLLKQALEMRRMLVDTTYPDLATCLDSLGDLYHMQARYAEAEPLYIQSLKLRENNPDQGLEHRDTATSLNNLGRLYDDWGKIDQARHFFESALQIRENAPGLQQSEIVISLNNLAGIYLKQREYSNALELYQRALSISRKIASTSPYTAQCLNNLGTLYSEQSNFTEAEICYKDALRIYQKSTLDPYDLQIAGILNNLAELYRRIKKYKLAEPLFERSLIIYKQALGPDHPSVARVFNNYAILLTDTGRIHKARQMMIEADRIREKHARENP